MLNSIAAVDSGGICKSPGLQVGYSKQGIGSWEGGLNYQWTKFRESKVESSIAWNRYNTFGVFANAIFFPVQTKTTLGYQVGVNYFWGMAISPRINACLVNFRDGDWRLGLDAGISIFGFYIYTGILNPIGKTERKEIYRQRAGIKFIFNLSGLCNLPNFY